MSEKATKQTESVGKVFLTNVRLAFANIFEAKAAKAEAEPRFSARFIIEPGSENAKKLDKAVLAVATETWKDKATAVLKKLVEDNRICYIRSDKTDKNGEVYEGFEDSYSISASNKRRPSIFDRDPKQQLVAADGRPYSGCYVNALVTVWAQDNQWGRRVNAELNGVQFVSDGDSFGGGRVASKDEFSDLGVDATAGSENVLW
jgi:Enterobacter phage Enc34, ssDNA-binding protein